MPDDFHLLKTVSVSDGEITLRIPQRWNVWPHKTDEGRWGCYEEEAHNPETDTGTLWIKVDHIRVNVVDDDPEARDDFEDIAKVLASAPADAGTTVIENELRRVDRGYRWHRVYDADEDGEPLRYFSTTFLFFYGPSLSIINFKLVLTQAQMDQPEYLELREIVAREIAAARLEPFVHLEEAAVERAWGKLARLNYADKVKIVIPDVFFLDQDEEVALPVPPLRPGSIDVSTEEITLCNESDGELVTVGEHYYVELLCRHLGELADRAAFHRLPDGAFAYLADAPGDGGPPRKHRWWNICFTHGKALIAQVTLGPSATGDGRAPDPAFARYLDGAVRRAKFPNFGEPVTALP